MLCEDVYSALEAVVSRYESDQIVVVRDVKATGEGQETREEWPTLWLNVSEQEKSLETVEKIWDFLFAHHITRRGLLIAMGGGILTDLAGFAASTYKRGIHYINIPTTLLAMIDASSGGKTGFNYHGLKNSIGTFAPPVETLICPAWLKSLPAKEFLSGFGEMLKTGLINNGQWTMDNGQWTMDNGQCLWNRLLQYDLDTMPVDALTPLIEQCVAVKERIVEADPKEEGQRKVLNFGHTFGHAIEEVSGLVDERVSGLEEIPHGYAVVYGMIAELYLSVTILGCPKAPLQQLTQLMLHYYGKPQCKCSDRARLIALMRQDKKNERAAQINCTLLRDVGSPVVNCVISETQADEALDYLFSL